MVGQHLVEKSTITNIISPVKSILEEYNEYMDDVINDQNDKDLIANIGKSLLLIKDYIVIYKSTDTYFGDLLISDINSCLYCIKYVYPKRFFYFSYRSTIETFIRLNSSKAFLRNVDEVFQSFQKENANILKDNNLYSDFYSKLKGKYSVASGYVHGSKEVSFPLREAIEYINNENTQDIISSNIAELKYLTDLIKRFYLRKDIELHNIKHYYRMRIPALKILLTSKEKKELFN